MSSSAPRQIIHATTVSVGGRGIVIVGASGSGKSSLALQLIAFGADLIADDKTVLVRTKGQLHASAPDTIEGRIEARGLGLLTLPFVSNIRVYLAVDLDEAEEHRLPYAHQIALMDVTVPCLYRSEKSHFAAALYLYAKTMKPLNNE